MGHAIRYVCSACGHVTRPVTRDFDSGMFAVTTPVVCPKHGIEQAAVKPKAPRQTKYPCQICGRLSPRWDHDTCPECGATGMGVDLQSMLLWD